MQSSAKIGIGTMATQYPQINNNTVIRGGGFDDDLSTVLLEQRNIARIRNDLGQGAILPWHVRRRVGERKSLKETNRRNRRGDAEEGKMHRQVGKRDGLCGCVLSEARREKEKPGKQKKGQHIASDRARGGFHRGEDVLDGLAGKRGGKSSDDVTGGNEGIGDKERKVGEGLLRVGDLQKLCGKGGLETGHNCACHPAIDNSYRG